MVAGEEADGQAVKRTETPAWWEPPQSEAPAVFPLVEIVATTPSAAVAVFGAHVYRSGMELQIERRVRRLRESDAEWDTVIDAFLERPRQQDRAAMTGLCTRLRSTAGPRWWPTRSSVRAPIREPFPPGIPS